MVRFWTVMFSVVYNSSRQDAYQLALELDKAWQKSIETGKPIDVVSSLRRY